MRESRFAMVAWRPVLAGLLVWAGCGGGGQPDGGWDAHDAEDGADAGCHGAAGLGEPCQDPCACQLGLACRGLPGDSSCLPPCDDYTDCEGAPAECAEPFCDFNLGACRCGCLEGQCGAETCFAGFCLGCALDEHCAARDCSSEPLFPTPRCDPRDQACVCGGACGDGACDPAEEAVGGCPADCPGPCLDGARKVFSCKTMEVVPWCTCAAGSWSCLPEPGAQCPGETECERLSGQCVDSVEACFDGQVAAEAHGCGSPICCLPLACTGPGGSYYPYLGSCCPGLRALPSRSPNPGELAGLEGMLCFDTCWALLCAPCGDGACQPWLGENFCTCPEDCPQPPYELVCQAEADCGIPYCLQVDEGCRELTPACAAGRCAWSTRELAGQLCDALTRRCVEPP